MGEDEAVHRTQAMVAALEKEMEARQMGISLTPEERFEVFGENGVDEHEAYERWGETEAWAQSQRRLAAALADGVPPDSPTAMDLAEEHRQQISRNFYDCPPEMHAGLGRMYVEDERFTAYYEQLASGLARYVSTAVQANAARQAA